MRKRGADGGPDDAGDRGILEGGVRRLLLQRIDQAADAGAVVVGGDAVARGAGGAAARDTAPAHASRSRARARARLRARAAARTGWRRRGGSGGGTSSAAVGVVRERRRRPSPGSGQARLWLVFSLARAELAVLVLSHSPRPREAACTRSSAHPQSYGRDQQPAGSSKSSRTRLQPEPSRKARRKQIHPSVNDLAGIWGKRRFRAGCQQPIARVGRRLMLKLRRCNLRALIILCVRVRRQAAALDNGDCRPHGSQEQKHGARSHAQSCQTRLAPGAPLAQAAPVDLAHLRRYTLGDRRLELEILGLFIDQAPLTHRGLQRRRYRPGLGDRRPHPQRVGACRGCLAPGEARRARRAARRHCDRSACERSCCTVSRRPPREARAPISPRSTRRLANARRRLGTPRLPAPRGMPLNSRAAPTIGARLGRGESCMALHAPSPSETEPARRHGQDHLHSA